MNDVFCPDCGIDKSKSLNFDKIFLEQEYNSRGKRVKIKNCDDEWLQLDDNCSFCDSLKILEFIAKKHQCEKKS